MASDGMSDKPKLSERAGDQTIAEAIRIAERRLGKHGWTHTARDIGKIARLIITGLDEDTPNGQ